MTSLLRLLLTIMFLALAFSAAVYSLWMVGPYLERWLAGPVVGKLELTSVMGTQEGRSIVFVEFDKRRPCEFAGLNWYMITENGAYIRVPVRLAELDTLTNNTRPIGKQSDGPWLVYLRPEDLISRSRAEVHHRCHGLWTTITNIYP